MSRILHSTDIATIKQNGPAANLSKRDIANLISTLNDYLEASEPHTQIDASYRLAELAMQSLSMHSGTTDEEAKAQAAISRVILRAAVILMYEPRIFLLDAARKAR